MRTVTRSVVLAFATGLTAGVIAGCQVYDFAPVRPLVISSQDIEVDVVARALKPNLMLLVDKSQSMDQPVDTSNANCPSGCGVSAGSPCPSNCPTRWSELQSAMSTFLGANGAVARMGLTTYPNAQGTTSAAACGITVVDSSTFDTSATAKLRLNIPVNAADDAALQSQATAIRDVLNGIAYNDGDPASTDNETTGGTPTGFSVKYVSELPEMNDTEREDLILLLTDGLPNCNPANKTDAGTPCYPCLDTVGASNQITDARGRGIRTIVVGFGAEAAGSEGVVPLNAMANAGGFPRRCDDNGNGCAAGDTCDMATKVCNNIRFYTAANAAELVSALTAIAGVINPTPCDFPLTQDPENNDSRFLVVYLTEPGKDTVKLAEGPDTWQYSPGMVKLVGETCDIVSNATAANPVRVSIRIVTTL